MRALVEARKIAAEVLRDNLHRKTRTRQDANEVRTKGKVIVSQSARASHFEPERSQVSQLVNHSVSGRHVAWTVCSGLYRVAVGHNRAHTVATN